MKNQATALVTGGAKRIGKAVCLKLASLDYAIALHYNRSKKDAGDLAKIIHEKGGRCELFSCDLANTRAVENLVKNVYKKFPSLNLLVNNASVFEKSKLKTSSLKSFDENIAIHLRAPFILSRDFSNVVKNGQIINILDTHVSRTKTDHFTYLLSKKALQVLTQLSSSELAPNIRVNAVAPGLILPPKNKNADYLNRLAKDIPLKKKGDPDNVTSAIEFLLQSTYITGQTLFVDGGEHLT